MEQPGPGKRPANFSVQVPPDLEGGTYANFLGVWHTGHEFTLDFAVTQPPVVPEDENEPVTVPSRVVARVKIPPTLIFDIMRALSENMTTYESTFGEIQRPELSQEDEPQ
jgi:Protein of unknown function (DUF3467)